MQYHRPTITLSLKKMSSISDGRCNDGIGPIGTINSKCFRLLHLCMQNNKSKY